MLKITDFSKTYKGGKKAVSHLNLEILPGDIYGFIGHNGAGKTTTIKAAVGILDFEEGEILIDGHSIEKEPLLCKSMLAYIPDNPDLYEHLTGIQYLNFIADIFRLDSGVRTERIDPFCDVIPCNGMAEKAIMGNLKEQSWEELWNSEKAKQVRECTRRCDRNCWMIGSASPAMHRYIWVPAWWVVKHKLFKGSKYSLSENSYIKKVKGKEDDSKDKESC